MTKKFEFIGKRIPKKDAFDKVNGQAIYTTDLNLPDMLQGKILRSPFAHARIKFIDTQRAKRLPGVKAVITVADTPKIKFGLFVQDELPLADEKVRFIGEEVAAVAAVDEETAEEALSLIRVEYEALSAVYDMEEALKQDAPRLHEGADNVAFRASFTRGDIQKGFQESDFISEEEFYTPLIHQAPLEPLCAVGKFDPDESLTLWAPLQEPGRSIFALAKALSMPIEKIRIIQPSIGGSFGEKNGLQPFYLIAALLSKKANKPVKLLNNRQEEMEAARPMVPMKIWSRIGMSRDGRLLAKESKIFADNGAYSSHGPAVTVAAAIRFDSVYRQQNIKTEANLVYTNNIPTGAYRGYGANQAAFALESHLDIMARELDIDPLDLRLRNATQTGDVSVHGWKIMSSGLTECLNRVATASKWSKQRPKRKKAHGLGLACSTHICGFRSPTPLKGSTAKVQIGEDGRIQVITGEGDIGQGAATVFTQIVAEELSVSPAKIEVSSLDTEKTPLSLGAYASRVTVIGGNAVLNAARDAKGKIFKMAAFILGEEPNEFYLKKEKVWSKTSPRKSITLKDVATEADRKGTPIIGEGAHEYEGDLLDKKTLFGNLSSNYSFSAHIAEVEVDPETGVVQVIRQFCAHDIGRAINPMACEGQIEGGVAQGMGCALSEGLIRHQGKILNSSFTDYKIPKAADMPQIKAFLVESNDPIGPYGAKGMGEEVAVPVAPAICNAIFDAIGVRVKELPIKPEKILRELRRMQG